MTAATPTPLRGIPSSARPPLPRSPPVTGADALDGPSSPGALPTGWREVISRSTGKVYYGNVDTGQTSWVRPTQPLQAQPRQESKNMQGADEAALLTPRLPVSDIDPRLGDSAKLIGLDRLPQLESKMAAGTDVSGERQNSFSAKDGTAFPLSTATGAVLGKSGGPEDPGLGGAKLAKEVLNIHPELEDWKRRTDNLAAAVLAAARVSRSNDHSPPQTAADKFVELASDLAVNSAATKHPPVAAVAHRQTDPRNASGMTQMQPVIPGDFDNPLSEKEDAREDEELSDWELSQSAAVDGDIMLQNARHKVEVTPPDAAFTTPPSPEPPVPPPRSPQSRPLSAKPVSQPAMRTATHVPYAASGAATEKSFATKSGPANLSGHKGTGTPLTTDQDSRPKTFQLKERDEMQEILKEREEKLKRSSLRNSVSGQSKDSHACKGVAIENQSLQSTKSQSVASIHAYGRAGVGLVFKEIPGDGVQVQSVLKGGGAALSSHPPKSGDRLLAVDAQDARRQTLSALRHLIVGDEGTTVELEFQDSEGKCYITRAQRHVPKFLFDTSISSPAQSEPHAVAPTCRESATPARNRRNGHSLLAVSGQGDSAKVRLETHAGNQNAFLSQESRSIWPGPEAEGSMKAEEDIHTVRMDAHAHVRVQDIIFRERLLAEELKIVKEETVSQTKLEAEARMRLQRENEALRKENVSLKAGIELQQLKYECEALRQQGIEMRQEIVQLKRYLAHERNLRNHEKSLRSHHGRHHHWSAERDGNEPHTTQACDSSRGGQNAAGSLAIASQQSLESVDERDGLEDGVTDVVHIASSTGVEDLLFSKEDVDMTSEIGGAGDDLFVLAPPISDGSSQEGNNGATPFGVVVPPSSNQAASSASAPAEAAGDIHFDEWSFSLPARMSADLDADAASRCREQQRLQTANGREVSSSPPLPLYPTSVDVAVDRGLNGMAPEQSDEESTRSFGHVQVPRRVSSLTPVETFSSDHDNTPLRPGDASGFGAKSPLLHPLSAQDDQEASIAHGPVSSASSGLSGPSPLSNGLRSNELDGLNGSRHGVASDKGSAALGGAGRRDRDMLVSGRADSPGKSTGDIDLEDLYGAYF